MSKAILCNKKVLVTGGAGFIGSNIIEKLLQQNNHVLCLDNFATGRRENIADFIGRQDFTLLEGDIRDAEFCNKSVQGVDVVLHQAALGSVPRSINDPKTTNDVNIGGFMNMIWAAKQAGVKRFVYAASSSTYGDNNELPKLEHRIGNPLSPYAVTKYVNELYARVFSDLYGIETVGLRYFNVFGRRQDPNGAYAAVFPKFIASFLKHEAPLIHGDGSQSRDFTYVENVIQANELAATTTNPDALNSVFNIAFGESNTLNELTREVKNLLALYDPAIASIEPVYGPERLGDIRHSLASIEKAQKLLGYQPEFDVHRGLKLAIDWYYQNLKD